MPETEVLPVCEYHDIGVVAYSPLARGVLTGKYSEGTPDPESRAGRKDARIYQTEMREESLTVARLIDARARAKGFRAAHFAFSWVIQNKLVASALGGPRTLAQWNDYVRALDYPWDPEDEALIDSLVVTGHPSTPGYNDPVYPITGRRVG
jgi:aryl-alcohol dehydrogenase (NADP+)